MNKGLRHELKMKKYKKRIRLMAATTDIYVNREGEFIYKPKTVDLLKDNAQHCYRDQSTPCSCVMCSRPDLQYNRARQKQSLIKELMSA